MVKYVGNRNGELPLFYAMLNSLIIIYDGCVMMIRSWMTRLQNEFQPLCDQILHRTKAHTGTVMQTIDCVLLFSEC